MDLLGDIGGILEALTILFGFFIFPISEFGFVLKSANQLLYAQTSSLNMFTGEIILLENISVYEISIHKCEKLKLFVSLIFGCKLSNRTKNLRKIYEKTQEKLE